MAKNEQSSFPPEIVKWVKKNPEHVENWMNDPEFRRNLLANPEEFGLAGESAEWVRERVQHHGVDRLVGAEDSYFAAM